MKMFKHFIYILLGTLALWVCVRSVYFNELLLEHPYLYWLFPTLFALIITVIFRIISPKLTSFLYAFFFVFIALLTTTNLVLSYATFCEPDKNTTTFILIIQVLINLLILTWLILKIVKNPKIVNPVFLILFVILNAGMNLYYEYSIYRMYDAVYFKLTGNYFLS